MQVLDRLNEVRLHDHDIDIVRLVDGHHIPGKHRRGHTHMLPPARDSHVRCSECEQSCLRAPLSPLGFRVRPRTHRRYLWAMHPPSMADATYSRRTSSQMLRPIDEANERLHVGGSVDPSRPSIGASRPSTMMSAGRCACLHARNLLEVAVPESTRAVAGSQTC